MQAQLALAISNFALCWSINGVSPSGILIFCGNSLCGIAIGPSAIVGPLAYPSANLGITGGVAPADERLLLNRGIKRRACNIC